jgi:DNA polymerase III subunit delta'
VITGLWDRVVGQPDAVARLEGAAEAPVHAYLFVGPHGSGKAAAARAFAAALVCSNRGCGTCRDCRLALAGQHPDVQEVERVGAAILTDQADEIVRTSALSPVEGERKVLVLHDFHLIQPGVPPKLLKTLEEPPPRTVFIVLADDVPPELVTIASRCLRVDFRPVPNDLVAAALEAEGIAPAEAHLAAASAGGDLDRARTLAGDPELAARHDAFRRVPHRLDGSGAAVVTTVDELRGLIKAAAAPLARRHAGELAELERQEEQLGLERRGDRRRLVDRHKREMRRHRIDELKAGLTVLAGEYRDALVAGTAHDPAAAVEAVFAVQRAIEALDRNPNEGLLLQALLLQLPPA